MDTERMYRVQGTLHENALTELEDRDLETAERYVEITRHLREIHALWQIFRFHVVRLQTEYTLMYDGTVYFRKRPADREEDYIAVNGLITSIISAGKTLVEAMGTFMKADDPPAEGYAKTYAACCRKLYDDCFAYRFMIRLRDYAQHGHLPADREGHHYYFDLINILKKPHYRHNRALADQMELAAQEALDVYGDPPRLSLTVTLAEFAAKLFTLYEQFLELAGAPLLESRRGWLEVLHKYPENKVMFAGTVCFIYQSIDGWAQAAKTEEDPLPMLDQFREAARGTRREYEAAWDALKKSMLTIQCDKKTIEIGMVE